MTSDPLQYWTAATATDARPFTLEAMLAAMAKAPPLEPEPPLCIHDAELQAMCGKYIHPTDTIGVAVDGVRLYRVGDYWINRTHPLFPKL